MKKLILRRSKKANGHPTNFPVVVLYGGRRIGWYQRTAAKTMALFSLQDDNTIYRSFLDFLACHPLCSDLFVGINLDALYGHPISDAVDASLARFVKEAGV